MKGRNFRLILVNLCGLLIANTFFYGMNPIGLGYFAAAYKDRKGRVFAGLAIALGYIMILPIVQVVKYLSILCAIIILNGLIESRKKEISIWGMSITTGLVTCLVSAGSSFFYNNVTYQLVMAFLEGVVAFAFTIIFYKGINYLKYGTKGQPFTNEQMLSVAMMLGLMVNSLPSYLDIGLSPSVTFALLSILVLGYKYGAGVGALIGAANGMALGIQENNLGYLGILCVLGIAAGVFRELGRILTALMYGLCILFVGVVYQELLYSNIAALLSTIIVFLFLPERFMYRIDPEGVKGYKDAYIRESFQKITKTRLRDFAESFLRLSKTFHGIADKKSVLTKQDVTDILNDISENLCSTCKKCSHCWQSHFSETYQEVETLLQVVDQKGYLDEEDIPAGFMNKCISLDSFVIETSRLFELAKLNLMWQNRMAESREAIAGQLSEVANIIDNFSEDLCDWGADIGETEQQLKQVLKMNDVLVRQVVMFEKRNHKQQVYMIAKAKKGRCITTKEVALTISDVVGKRMRPVEGTKNVISRDYDTIAFTEDTVFKVLTGSARATKVNEKISGDNFSFIELDSGEMVMSLSDGMGTGRIACEESESVIELLEQFMEAGFKQESAIKLINSILVLKSANQSFSTIDLSIINLYTGVCEFIKIGASATFIKREDWVETITSTTIPVGIFNQVDFDGKSKKLYDGDFVVMVTDGVLDCIKGKNKEEFIGQFLMDMKMKNPQEIANRILQEALEENDQIPVDDMTVLVAGVWKK